MRLPNGYGSIYKRSGNLRKPWCVKKTTGWKPNGQPLYYYVGYYATKAEAMEALALYNHAPNAQKATFKEVFDLWWEEVEPTLKVSVRRSYGSVIERLAPLSRMKLKDIHLTDMERMTMSETKYVGRTIKTILGKVFE